MSTVVPPPPSGSILQKQSSFSRPKMNPAAAANPSPGKPAGGMAPAATPSSAMQPPPQQPQQQPMAPPPPQPMPPPQQPMAPPQPQPMPPQQRNVPNGAAPPAVSPARPVKAPAKQPQPMPQPGGAPPAGHPGQPAAPPGMWGPNGQVAPAAPAMSPASGAARAKPGVPAAGAPPAGTPQSGAMMQRAPAAGGHAAGAGPAMSPASGAKRPSGGAQPGAGARARPQPQPQPQPQNQQPPQQAGLQRQNSMNGNPYGSMAGGFGSMGPGQMGTGYGSMAGAGPNGGMGSMMAGPMASTGTNALGGYGSMGGGQMAGYGSMAGAGPNGGMGSMMGGPMAGSAYGGMGGYGSMAGNPYGSMAGGQDGGMAGAGSAYGGMSAQGGDPYGSMAGGQNGMGSMMGGPMGSLYGGMGGGSMYGGMGGSMMGGNAMVMPMGSMYGMGGPAGSMYGMGGMSANGIAAEWGALGSMMNQGSQVQRSGISSGYGGFATEAGGIDMEDLCPNIGTFEDAKDLPRSGKRGGNHLYSRDKHEKPVATGNSNATAMTIRRKSDVKGGAAASPANGASSSNSPATTKDAASRSAPRASPAAGASSGAGGKARAKVPSNYNVHSLIIVDNATGAAVTTVKDPNTVVFEKDGKKESFEADEALARATAKDDVDSVLLSELRGNWFNGHNSALMMCAGKGKAEAAQDVARQFVRKCMERLEKNEKDTSVKFDTTMSMVSLRGADQCCDLFKSGAAYGKAVMGSSPVYGPCLLELESRVHKTATECVASLDEGFRNAKEEKEIVTAFLVLKTIKKTGSEEEVHLSSLCIALCGETVSHMTDIRNKASSAPHRLFRYAVDGACVTVSGLCLAADDAEAREALEVERKMREVKNQPPRSGNVKRFVDYTYKEITRQKDKLPTASENSKKMAEAMIARMEEMVKDAKDLIAAPETTQPKGYSAGR